MANTSHTKIKPRFTYHIIQTLHVIKARQYSVMACQIFTPLMLSTKALYHFVHSDSLCTLKGFLLKKTLYTYLYTIPTAMLHLPVEFLKQDT